MLPGGGGGVCYRVQGEVCVLPGAGGGVCYLVQVEVCVTVQVELCVRCSGGRCAFYYLLSLKSDAEDVTTESDAYF